MRREAHVRFGEERQGNSSTTPCLLLHSPPGRASYSWRLSSMSSPAGSLAGGWRARCARTWCWMRWSRPCGREPGPRAWCMTATGAVPVDPLHGASRRSWCRVVGRHRWRLVRECPGRVDHRSVQDGDHSPAWAMAPYRRCRIRDPGLGGLVQQPPAAGADWQYPAGRVGGGVLSSTERVGHGGLTQVKQSPGFPGRFS
jgi:hypothetical protein